MAIYISFFSILVKIVVSIEKISLLLENEQLFEKMRNNARKTAKKFDIDDKVCEYIEYFKNVKKQKIILTKREEEESKRWIVGDSIFEVKKENKDNNQELQTQCQYTLKRKIYILFLKMFPKSLKTKIKSLLKKMIGE